MINILICEQTLCDQKSLHHLIHQTFSKYSIPYTITYAQQTLFAITEYDLLFIDANLFHSNAFRIKEQVNQYHLSIPVILTSDHDQYMHQGYTLENIGYLKKPFSLPLFQETIRSLIQYHFKDYLSFVDFRISPYRLYVKDILYVMFSQRHSYLYMIQRHYKTTYPLHYWRSLLCDYEFGQSYKGFIVSFRHIRGFSKDKKDIYLSNGQKVPLSKKYKPSFLQDYTRYMKSMH